jgi:hypothetical protein
MDLLLNATQTRPDIRVGPDQRLQPGDAEASYKCVKNPRLICKPFRLADLVKTLRHLVSAFMLAASPAPGAKMTFFTAHRPGLAEAANRSKVGFGFVAQL